MPPATVAGHNVRLQCLLRLSWGVSERAKNSISYDSLKQAVAINLLAFNLFDDWEDYHSEVVAEVKGKNQIFSDKFGIHFFELKKVKWDLDNDSLKILWLQFLNASTQEDFKMIDRKDNPVINKAVHAIVDMSRDTQLRERARIREKVLHDEASLLKEATHKGRAEGKTESVMAFVQIFKQQGMSDAQIQAILSQMKD